MNILKLNASAIFIALCFIACDSKPRVIAEEQSSSTEVSASSIPAFKDLPGASPKPASTNAGQHKVLVKEILDTEKYSYLKVSEGEREYWIAISKNDVVVGETYFYEGGLLKRNFFSREFNRVFETVYLVSKIWKDQGGKSASALEEASSKIKEGESLPNLKVEKVNLATGATPLADLFSNKEKYNGQTIKITGKCVKVNPMIMNRNWLHIQDGSGKDLDLTVTTTETVPLGAVVSLEGIIVLDKDFGAGYRYDIIMEGAVLK